MHSSAHWCKLVILVLRASICQASRMGGTNGDSAAFSAATHKVIWVPCRNAANVDSPTPLGEIFIRLVSIGMPFAPILLGCAKA